MIIHFYVQYMLFSRELFKYINLKLGTLHSRDVSQTLRAYSMYPPAYIKPVYQKEKLEELIESGEAKEREFTPVRAAYSSHTSSVFYDPIVA